MAESISFAGHLAELRWRLITIVLVFGIAASVGYVFRLQLANVITSPLKQHLFYNSPSGGFDFFVQISVFLGIIVTTPLTIFHLIRFIEPAFNKRFAVKVLLTFISASLFLVLVGVAFAYLVIIPVSLQFFQGFNTQQIQPLISTDTYLGFIGPCLLTFALIFQIPLVAYIINLIVELKARSLLKYQKYIVVGSLIFALILPFTYDPVTQFLIAVPVIVIYYTSIFIIYVSNRRRIRNEERPRTYARAATLNAAEISPKKPTKPEIIQDIFPPSRPKPPDF